jgi:hypothetical protein
MDRWRRVRWGNVGRVVAVASVVAIVVAWPRLAPDTPAVPGAAAVPIGGEAAKPRTVRRRAEPRTRRKTKRVRRRDAARHPRRRPPRGGDGHRAAMRPRSAAPDERGGAVAPMTPQDEGGGHEDRGAMPPPPASGGAPPAPPDPDPVAPEFSFETSGP